MNDTPQPKLPVVRTGYTGYNEWDLGRHAITAYDDGDVEVDAGHGHTSITVTIPAAVVDAIMEWREKHDVR